jgi:hypothetical protein
VYHPQCEFLELDTDHSQLTASDAATISMELSFQILQSINAPILRP